MSYSLTLMVDEAQLIPASLLEFYANIFPTHYYIHNKVTCQVKHGHNLLRHFGTYLQQQKIRLVVRLSYVQYISIRLLCTPL